MQEIWYYIDNKKYYFRGEYMECKKCGQVLGENVKFCGKCGTHVEQMQMEPEVPKEKICSSCQAPIREGAKFCKQCGTSTGEVAATISPEVNGMPFKLPEIKKYLVSCTQLVKKPVAKIAGGILVTVIVLTIVLSNMPKASTQAENQLLTFWSDNDAYGKYMGKDKFAMGTQSSMKFVTKDSKQVFFIDEESLYVIKEGKNKEKIASDVTSFAISAYGDTVAYVKGENAMVGPLYVKVGNKEAQKISQEALPAITISDNGKYVAFIENEDPYSMDDATGYIFQVGKEKQKISKALPTIVHDDGSVIGVNNERDLYRVKKGKDSEKIGTGVVSLVANKDLSKLAFSDEQGDLYFYNGKDKEKIDKNVSRITNSGRFAKQIVGDGFTQLSTDQLDLLYVKNDSTYFKIEGQDAEKISSGSEWNGYVQYSEDMRNFVCVYEGNLYIRQFSSKKMTFSEKIDSDVTDSYISTNGKNIVYIKDDDLYYIQPGKKEGVKVASDVYNAQVKNDGSIFFVDDDDTLYMTKNKKDKIKIKEDIIHWVVDDKSNLYMIDRDNVLYEKAINKEAIKVSDDINYIYFSEINSRFSIGYYNYVY